MTTPSDEFIKTVKTVHITLIVIATGFLGFALAPSDSARYGAARAELELLRAVPFEDFPSFVAPTTTPHRTDTTAFLRKFMPTIIELRINNGTICSVEVYLGP